MVKYLLAAFLTFAGIGAANASGLDDAGAALISAQHGNFDEAIRLFSRALAGGDLSPNNTMLAYHNRGNAYQDKGDYAHAIADYDNAIRLKPDYAGAHYARGRAQFASGAFAGAASDFARSATLDPNDAYTMLWLHMARRKLAATDAGELSRNAAKIDLADWPGALINLYLGKGTQQQARAASAKGEAEALHEQACEATFYIAEYELLRKNIAAAKSLFQEAVKTCPLTTDEYDGAVAELKRL